MTPKIKSIVSRFLKGALSGALTAMGMVTVVAPSNWTELATIVNILAVAGSFGAINGAILAGMKWYSWKE